MVGVGELADKMQEKLNFSGPNSVLLPSHLEKFSVTHAPTFNAMTWKAALAASTDVHDGYLFTKTLIFKPKLPKDQPQTLIMVVALDDTSTNSKQIASAVNAKEARFATADFVKETLGVSVEQGIPTLSLMTDCLSLSIISFN